MPLSLYKKRNDLLEDLTHITALNPQTLWAPSVGGRETFLSISLGMALFSSLGYGQDISPLDVTLPLTVVRVARIWSGVAPCGDDSRLRLPGVGAEDALNSRHATVTELFLEPQRAAPPDSNPPQRG